MIVNARRTLINLSPKLFFVTRPPKVDGYHLFLEFRCEAFSSYDFGTRG